MPLQGDVAMPEDFEEDSEPETEGEEDESVEESIDGEQLLEENREAIDRMCRGCNRQGGKMFLLVGAFLPWNT